DGAFPGPEGPRPYHVRRVPLGFGLMFVAGITSGLLGIGSGALKVLAMDQVMRIPFKGSTTTSNFLIGVTAAAHAGEALGRRPIDRGGGLRGVRGGLAGSFVGARLLVLLRTAVLRWLFIVVIAPLAAQMIWKGLSGGPS